MTPVHVLDTHAVAHFLKRKLSLIGRAAREVLCDPLSRLAIPVYVIEELRNKARGKPGDINIPPTPCLRLLRHAANVRIIERGIGASAEETRLRGLVRQNSSDMPAQDAAVAAAAIVARYAYRGEVRIITGDGKLSAWASREGFRVVWKA